MNEKVKGKKCLTRKNAKKKQKDTKRRFSKTVEIY